MPGPKTGIRILAAMALAATGWALPAAAQLKTDPLVGSDLPAKPGPHWMWVNDVVFHHMADGKAFLVDGDTGVMRGMLSTGFGFNGVVVPRTRSVILSPEVYFSRGTRGKRTDVVTVYDPRKLAPVAEIGIPPKRGSHMPMVASASLTDDDRFLVIYNYTPAQTVSVVDVKARKFVGEIDTAGCALVYPTGPRSFFSLCGDGTALTVRLDDTGKGAAKARTKKLFDPVKDPVTEKGVRRGDTWYFATFAGDVVPIQTAAEGTKAGTRWSLLDAADRKASWRPGGMQHLSLHSESGRLYSLMHVGGEWTHKDPGTEVWVYDLANRKRERRIKLEGPTTSIAITPDANPVLFAIFIGAPKVDVYDPKGGKLLRSIGEIGFTPTTLVPY
jgi:methylamine dehydrogenase heavy chain